MLRTKINADLTANSNHFYFDYQNGKYGYNTDPNRGAGTFSPFSKGAVKVGSYTAATVNIDVSAYGATSADQFLVVQTGNISSQVWAIQGGQGMTMQIWLYSYKPTWTLNGNTLTVNAPKARATGTNWFDETRYAAYDVYFIG